MNDLLDSLHHRTIFQRKGHSHGIYHMLLRQDDPGPEWQNACEDKTPQRADRHIKTDGGNQAHNLISLQSWFRE